jgi:benzoylformate decarboxylase
MQMRPITANPSQVIVEQLVASGVKYVFYNSGSREAHFFNALHENPGINGILALHEGSVTAMAGGYTQAKLDPAVMVVHLGAGLAQCLGQLINVWTGSLPVVVITFAGDTGSFADAIGLDLSHSFGPTSISAPFTKANWTVIEPEGLPQAIDRALRVATTPPVGPVHIAVYDRLLNADQVNTSIIEGSIAGIRSGYPADSDVEQIVQALNDAKRPVLHVGDGVWKSGAEAQAAALAEHFGLPIVADMRDMRSVPIKHPLHAGRADQALDTLDPDLILCVGVRHSGAGVAADFGPFIKAQRVIAVGSDLENFKNVPGLDLAVMADERRTVDRVLDLARSGTASDNLADRRARAREEAASLRAERRKAAESVGAEASRIRPWVLGDALDRALERRGGGTVMIEQFAVPLDALGGSGDPGNNVYIRPAGGSEGYGVGGAIGVKLGAPERPVVGLVGDGSLYYADSGMWTAAHHDIPLLYVIPNNEAYGIVAGFFGQAGGYMKQSGNYGGVVLDKIDPVKIAEGFGVEGMHVEDEDRLEAAIDHGLDLVQREKRPFVLNAHLLRGLPKGGRAETPFSFRDSVPEASQG